MSMTLWIQTLEDREYSGDSDDHSIMHQLSEELDELCNQLQVKRLSEFYDYTDLNHNFKDELDDFDEDDYDEDDDDEDYENSDLDPETGLIYGIDDMTWFNAEDGLNTLSKLHTYLEDNEVDRIDELLRDELLNELDDCIQVLEPIAERKGKFHLSVIM